MHSHVEYAASRLLIGTWQAEYKVTVLKGTNDADSIGQFVCRQAEQLGAAVVVMAAHNKGRQVKFIVGSVTRFCIKFCNKTVLVMH